MGNRDAEKRAAARRAAAYVEDGMVVGLGSGSTAAHAIRILGERVREEGLRVAGVPTSPASRDVALACGVPLLKGLAGFSPDLAIDGADEAMRSGELIKGAGGALLHERIVASAAARFIVIVDAAKVVDGLGGVPLPVEITRFGWRNVFARIQAEGGSPILRMTANGQPFLSDEENYIADCWLPPAVLAETGRLNAALRSIPGVADHGLFLGLTDLILIGSGEGVEEISIVRERKT